MTTEHGAWLALTSEEPIEPALPICDPHHHLWDRLNFAIEPRYLLAELLRDTGSGHNVVRTVFVECQAMYRQDGPVEMRPVGETEFVQGIAAQSASGQYGPTAVAAGIVSFADLTLGDAVAPVLEAHAIAGAHRLRGIRYPCAYIMDGKNRTGKRPKLRYNTGHAQTLYISIQGSGGARNPERGANPQSVGG